MCGSNELGICKQGRVHFSREIRVFCIIAANCCIKQGKLYPCDKEKCTKCDIYPLTNGKKSACYKQIYDFIEREYTKHENI